MLFFGRNYMRLAVIYHRRLPRLLLFLFWWVMGQKWVLFPYIIGFQMLMAKVLLPF